MTQILIDKKKYVLIPEADYLKMQKNAALKINPEKTFTIAEAKGTFKKTYQAIGKGKVATV